MSGFGGLGGASLSAGSTQSPPSPEFSPASTVSGGSNSSSNCRTNGNKRVGGKRTIDKSKTERSVAHESLISEYEQTLTNVERYIAEAEESVKSRDSAVRRTSQRRLIVLRGMRQDVLLALRLMRKDAGWGQEVMVYRPKCVICGTFPCKHTIQPD